MFATSFRSGDELLPRYQSFLVPTTGFAPIDFSFARAHVCEALMYPAPHRLVQTEARSDMINGSLFFATKVGIGTPKLSATGLFHDFIVAMPCTFRRSGAQPSGGTRLC